MKLTSILFSLLPAVMAIPASNTTRYAGVKVVRVPTGGSQEYLDALEDIVARLELESWTTTYKTNSHVDLEVPATKYEQFTIAVNSLIDASEVRNLGFDVEVMHDDLEASIFAESEGSNERTAVIQAGLANPAWWNAYHSYADHLTFLSDLSATYPNNSRVFTAGTTVEGRNITGIRIFGSSGPGTKPAVIWHGNVHAREWVTGVTVEYFAYQLLSNYANTTDIKALVDKFEFYVLPIVNPDGFVYTQTTERLWRKNRTKAPSGSSCIGIDINRNWDAHWSDTGGASTSPCAQDYKGKAPHDAPETAALAKLERDLANSTAGAAMFIDFHSYSQMFFVPYGYTCDKLSPDHTELMALAEGFVDNLGAVYGTSYEYGPSCIVIYKTTGSSDDFAYENVGIKYSFSAELRDTGRNGFVLPANQIRPTAVETWAGLLYVLKNLDV